MEESPHFEMIRYLNEEIEKELVAYPYRRVKIILPPQRLKSLNVP